MTSYLGDASGYSGRADAVHAPRSEGELSELLRSASQSATPVTISGAGTGVTGGRVPQGGWVISLEHFQNLRIGEGEAVSGSGVTLRDLQAAAARRGQFFAPDPTEMSASIGGALANNASGSRSFLYGDMRRHTLGLRVALIDGSIREYRRGQAPDFDFHRIEPPQTTKHSAGYFLRPGMDALDVFIGAEGTLGVIVEATLKLLPQPSDLLTGVIFFASLPQTLDAVEAWRSIPNLRMLEYFDTGSLGLLRPRYPEIPANARAAILVEQQEAKDVEIEEWVSRLEKSGALAEQSWFGLQESDRERFRRFRHAVPEAVNDIVRSRGVLKMATDFAVPLLRNREMMTIYSDVLDREFAGQYVIFGHIGDAHVHVNILPADAVEAERARLVIIDLAKAAVGLGGTVSAEHGLGKRKAHLMEIQYAPEDVESMKAVKRLFDPNWLLGQGTLLAMRG